MSLPGQGNPVALGPRPGRRPRHGVHGLDRREADDLHRPVAPADLRDGGPLARGPVLLEIYDVDIGPWDKIKHVIEPRIDYTYVSNVERPGEDPGLRHDRHDARREPGPLRDRQPPARPDGRAARRARRRRSPRSRSRRRTTSRFRRRSSCRIRRAIARGARADRSRRSCASRREQHPPRRRHRRLRPPSVPDHDRDRHRRAPTGARTTST